MLISTLRVASVEDWGKLSGGKVFLFVKTFRGEKMNLKMRILGIEEYGYYLWSIWDVWIYRELQEILGKIFL